MGGDGNWCRVRASDAVSLHMPYHVRACEAFRHVVAKIEGGSFVNPVFSDASGTRVSAIQWGSRVFLALVVLLGVALALTLRSHVSVPGLERLAPGVEAEQGRPAVRLVPLNPPAERTAERSGPTTLAPRPTSRSTTVRVNGSTADPVESADTRRVVASSTAPAAEPSNGPALRATAGVPTVRAGVPSATAGVPTATAGVPTATAGPPATARPTASASPTMRIAGPKAVKTRNPKAATPSPPGRNRTPKPEPATGIG